MTNPHEEWRDVVGWEGVYEVSNLGRVARKERVIEKKSRWGGTVKTRIARKIMAQFETPSGYKFLVLRRKGVIPKNEYVHRLVLTAFCGLPRNGLEACHNDGNKSNNCLENLRWDTRARNHADKKKHGTNLEGETHPAAKLADEEIRIIRKRALSGERQSKIADEYGICQQTVSDIKLRKRRKTS